MSVEIANPVKRIIQAAVQAAVRFGHGAVTADHLLYALLSDNAAAALLGRCGCDLLHVERELLEYLELLPEQSGRVLRDPRSDATFTRVIETAALRALRAGKPLIEIADLLVPILDQSTSYASMLLGAEGLTRLELLRCVSHGTPAPPLYRSGQGGQGGVRAPGARVHVVLHNDHYTGMEFVVRVLEEVFAHSERAAAARMMQVHTEGRALVGSFELAVALAKAEEVRALATEAGFPLLCTVEEAG